jgi:hypothetical protein
MSAIAAKDHAFRLLERLDHRVEQDAVKASVAKANAALVMLEKHVHGGLHDAQMPGSLLH